MFSTKTSISPSTSPLARPNNPTSSNLLQTEAIKSPTTGLAHYFNFLKDDACLSLPAEIRNSALHRVQSLRALQKTAIFNMLEDKNLSTTDDIPWVILILDSKTQQILAPSIDIDELRSRGVTLFLPLEREQSIPLPDTIFLYFVSPTQNNISRICRDFQTPPPLYSFNFCGSISRTNLEELAHKSVIAGIGLHNHSSRITQVTDRLVDFICLEENLFSLGLENAFSISHSFQNEETKNLLIDSCIDGLLSVVATLEMVSPRIKASVGSFSVGHPHKQSTDGSLLRDYLVPRLQQKLKDFYAQGKRKVKKEPISDLLLIYDRSEDMVTPLKHKWTYGALVHDFFKVRLNRVSGIASEAGKEKQATISWKDSLWKVVSTLSFPDACSLLGEELNLYQNSYSQIEESQLVAEIAPLKKAIEDLPALREKKKWIDTHLILASALLTSIQERRPDLMREMEILLVKKGVNIDAAFLPLLLHPDQRSEKNFDPELSRLPGHEQDQIRILLIAFLASGKNPKLLPIFQESLGLQDSPLVLKLISFLSPEYNPKSVDLDGLNTQSAPLENEEVEYTASLNILDSISSTGTAASSRLAKMVLQGIKRISGSYLEDDYCEDDDRSLPVVRFVDNILNGDAYENGSTASKDFRHFSAASIHTQKTDSYQPTALESITPQRLVLFVFGGITYDEYQALNSYITKNWPGTELIVGSTSLLSSKDFLCQLECSHSILCKN